MLALLVGGAPDLREAEVPDDAAADQEGGDYRCQTDDGGDGEGVAEGPDLQALDQLLVAGVVQRDGAGLLVELSVLLR